MRFESGIGDLGSACGLAIAVIAAIGMGPCEADPELPPSRMVIVCIGDSITSGVTRSRTPEQPRSDDSLGGYPGRLQLRLGDEVRVLNRGIAGSTTRDWLDDAVFKDRRLWGQLGKLWPDFGSPPLPAKRGSLALGVLDEASPDIAILFLGVNDLHLTTGGVDDAAKRLNQLVEQARSVANEVLVATALPNKRDPPDLLAALNRRIRSAHPDFLPLARKFADAGWENLLGDVIHPTDEGYRVLAQIITDELVARGLVKGRTADIAPAGSLGTLRLAKALAAGVEGSGFFSTALLPID